MRSARWMGVKCSLCLIKDREQTKIISENGEKMGLFVTGLWQQEVGRAPIQWSPAQPDIEDCPSSEKPPNDYHPGCGFWGVFPGSPLGESSGTHALGAAPGQAPMQRPCSSSDPCWWWLWPELCLCLGFWEWLMPFPSLLPSHPNLYW